MKTLRSVVRRLSEALPMRTKLVMIFLVVKVIPLIVLTVIAWRQFVGLGEVLRDISVSGSRTALNTYAVESLERMTTDTARQLADFLYDCDDDILFLAAVTAASPDAYDDLERHYREFGSNNTKRLITRGEWRLTPDENAWVPAEEADGDTRAHEPPAASSNPENNDMDGFRYHEPELFEHENVPIYDEITFIDLLGNEKVKVVIDSPRKVRYPLNPVKTNVSDRLNTYVKAETYFAELSALAPGEVYVSEVVGAYVGSNYIGMYTPKNVAEAASERGYEIEYAPQTQAYAGMENPNGMRFEGIVRYATPVTNEKGVKIGYVTFALCHDQIMEFVDHITPANGERYTRLPSAFEGNYAFIWDYKCRSIVHPRHHSIVGYDPQTGTPQIPWLEETLYADMTAAGYETKDWRLFMDTSEYPVFNNQTRDKQLSPELAKLGLVGLDGRYMNNAPQCLGWMEMTEDGGSGSFYLLWSGIYKLTTVASIPYYTGRYAPERNDGSLRGFGFVTVGSGFEDFQSPAAETERILTTTINDDLGKTFAHLVVTTLALTLLVIFVAFWMASVLTNNVATLIRGIDRFRSGERHFRFRAPVKDEFGYLADSFDVMADSVENSVTTPLSIIDMELKVLYMNKQGQELCGKTEDDILGRPYYDYSVFSFGSAHCPVTAFREGREPEILRISRGGREMYIKGSARYFRDKDGRNIGYLIQATDVTEMVLRQTDLEQAVDDANRANAHKSEFLARMSHEIRTPMNAIIGVTNMIQRKLDDPAKAEAGAAPGEIRELVDQIEASSQHLLGLLNDILDISKIDAGKIELEEEIMEPARLAETVTGIIRPRCDEKHIRFETFFDDFSDTAFLCDALRLRQVLINLLGNAVKFTPEYGTITFRIARTARENGESVLAFSVVDTGIGIADEALERLFRPFEQGDGTVSRQYGGTGLGLAISQRIVRLFGGEIHVESTPGEGSTFSFSVRLRETAPEQVTHADTADTTGLFANKRALVVDDVDINRMILVSILEVTGMLSDEAGDGGEALAKFEAAPAGTYDVIFMDVQMPVLNGYEATAAIRASKHPDAADIPIIALTANAFKEDIDNALASGMNAHMAKPVDPDALSDMLFRFLRKD